MTPPFPLLLDRCVKRQVDLDAFRALWEVDKETRFLMEMATEMLWVDLDPGGLDDLGR